MTGGLKLKLNHAIKYYTVKIKIQRMVCIKHSRLDRMNRKLVNRKWGWEGREI